MPIQHVIAYTKLAARYTYVTTEAGNQADREAAVHAAKRVIHAACAAQMHALGVVDLAPDDPSSTLEGVARMLSELAAGSAWGARAVVQAVAHEDCGLATYLLNDAYQAATAAMEAADRAEGQITAPSSSLCREAARLAMERAMEQASSTTGLHLEEPSISVPSEVLAAHH
jgi:hypothetical protein